MMTYGANNQRAVDYLLDECNRIAMRLRVKCAVAHGISIDDTYATAVPDPDNPNVVTITAYPRAELVSDDKR